MSTRIAQTSHLGALGTVREGLRLSPAMREGIGITALLAVVATAGKLIVPLAVQVTTDRGLLADSGVNVALVMTLCLLCALALLATTACTTWVNIRLYKAAEAGLAQLRVRAFRHVHDLSTLTQDSERRGALVSRVTSDVDTISLFVQWGGMQLALSTLQILAATVAMLVYSWQLTLVVWAAFIPMLVLAPRAQRALNRAYGVVRTRIGNMLAQISEAILGAETIRAYGAQRRTQQRLDTSVVDHRNAAVRAQTLAALAFSAGVVLGGVALGGVVVAGTVLGIDGTVTTGELLAFLFLVQLFTGPVQSATEVLNQLQNAVAGWRRVIGLIQTPVDIADPVTAGPPAPRGPAGMSLTQVNYAYPDGPPVLRNVDLSVPAGARVAIVGATGSGKTTIAKLLTRTMDPTSGSVQLAGVDLRRLTLSHLRRRVVIVPQEGFLFDGSIATNVVYGPRRRDRTTAHRALQDLGLLDWIAALPEGIDTGVGGRGAALSAGERQLIAIARAYLADSDVLILDEATSAVDPATERRIATALQHLTAGRTSITIAHRLSTAEAADLVVVVEAGEIVQLGPHEELVDAEGPYARMHASWVSASG